MWYEVIAYYSIFIGLGVLSVACFDRLTFPQSLAVLFFWWIVIPSCIMMNFADFLLKRLETHE